MKYAQSGWWNTSALTLASGSIIMPSVSCTPMSSGLEQLPDALLIVEVRAGRIAEAVALAAIARREPLLHGHGWADRGSPNLRGMRRCSHSAQPSAVSIASAWIACALKNSPAAFAASDSSRTSFAGGDDEQREVIALAVAQARERSRSGRGRPSRLPAEVERVQRLLCAGLEQVDRVAVALGLEELPDRAHLHERRGSSFTSSIAL